MKINFTKSLFVLTLALSVTSGLFAQATTPFTTLSAALSSANTATVAVTSTSSNTGVSPAITMQPAVLGAFQTDLWVDGELIGVISISSTTLTVQRGLEGTKQTSHLSGATVWWGPPSYFSLSVTDPAGSCVAANEIALPRFFVFSGNGYACPANGPHKGAWDLNFPRLGTAGNAISDTSLFTVPSGGSVCHAQYSFAVDGGAVSTITPLNNCVIPKNSLVYKAVIYSEATPVGTTGNVSAGLSAGGSGAAALLAATARASLATGDIFQGVPVDTTASTQNSTYFVTTAAGSVTFTVSSNALTAGIVDVYVWYVNLPV